MYGKEVSMVEDKIDRRIIKTKKSLGEALLKLLRKEKIDLIKINELCDEAKVSRATFYNNFDSIVDVLSYQLGSMLYVDEEEENTWITASTSLEQAYRSFLTHIIHNALLQKDTLKAINGGLHENGMFLVAFRSSIRDGLRPIVKKYCLEIEKEIPSIVLMNYLSLSLASYVYYTLLGDHNSDENVIVENGYNMTLQLIKECLKKYPFYK